MGVTTPEASEAVILRVIVSVPDEISTFVGDAVNEDKTGLSKSFCEYPFSPPIASKDTSSKKRFKNDNFKIIKFIQFSVQQKYKI